MDDHHLSLTSPGPAGLNLERPLIAFDIMPSQQENMNFTTSEVHGTGKDPLARWYFDNDGPWNTPGLMSNGGDASGQSLVPSGMRDDQYIVPNRSNMVPSEIIAQSDSGYGSYHHQPSIANRSVCDDSFDAHPDTQSIMGASMADAQFPMPDTMSGNHIIMGASSDTWPSRIPLEINTCEECGKPVRTNSEKKKHEQRHKKPFKCDVADCSRRIEGFATPNDLDRHKRSVHPGSQTIGNRYVCQVGPCKNKDKIWPRADNFKAHLKRVHMKETVSDEDLESCIYKPQTALDEPQDNPQPDAISGYSEYAGLTQGPPTNWPQYMNVGNTMSQFGPLNEAQVEETLSLSSPQGELGNIQFHQVASRQELYRGTAQPDPICQSPATSSSPPQHSQLPNDAEMADPSSPPTKEQFRQMTSEAHSIAVATSDSGLLDNYSEPSMGNSPVNSLHEHLIKRDGCAIESPEPERGLVSGMSPLKLDIASLDLDDANKMKRLVEALDSRGFLGKLGYKKEGPEAVMPAKVESDGATSPTHQFPCSTCSKSFPRRCELKKHEKRHEKPYGCTMPNCDKRFGSKNDWKRHENTQHNMSEMWKCDVEHCEKHCNRREMLRAHLEKDHQIGDSVELDTRLENCRVGRKCEARFWCGFCEKIIEIKQQGKPGSSTERFDHIDEHFSGRNDQNRQDISNWKAFNSSWSGKEDFGDETCLPPKNGRGQKAKRKRDNENNLSNSKRVRLQSRGVVCCHCGDLMTVSMLRCINFPCEHIPCENCKS
ncbi:hypothetical protein F5Y08DRAFT_354135 [Xylaria arbuscula]|nr:hypothetical protein F5Y08DRAFT_354135 [Xylaria arbuscula]